jgi:biotin carboxylase
MMPIYGYNFPNNNASITKIFDDKSGFSEILIKNKIKCFSHTYFMKGYYELSSVKTLFSSLNEDVVIKPNVGSGGNNVYHCTSFSDLEEKINLITSSHLGFCISPFYSYTTEYRAIILNKKIKIVYQKIKKDEE